MTGFHITRNSSIIGTERRRGLSQGLAAGHKTGFTRKGVEHRISSYADLYVYLFFHAARFLKAGGRMGIVTSNAWLDVSYGHELQKFFLKQFKIVAILESRCEPWFVEASVNTIVTIVERCDDATERDNHLVKFVKVKKSLAELIPGDPAVDGATRNSNLRKIVKRLEDAGRKYANTHPIGVVTEEDDQFRVRLLRQSEMQAELHSLGKTVKWGRYLRAPQVYFDIIKRGKVRLLGEIAIPLRGGMTQIINSFMSLRKSQPSTKSKISTYFHSSESPKERANIRFEISELELRVFVCRRSKAELKSLGHRGALQYIKWGETQRWSDGTLWKDGVWVKDRKPGWWALPPSETHPAHIFLCKAIDQRHLHRFSRASLIANREFVFFKSC